MKIEVNLQSILKERVKGGDKPLEVDIAKGFKVKDLIVHLGLNPGEVGLIINHHHQIMALEDLIEEEMRVSIYPIVGGG